MGKLEVPHVECDKCGRRGRYPLDRLIRPYGIDAKLFEWSNEIAANCPRKQLREPVRPVRRPVDLPKAYQKSRSPPGSGRHARRHGGRDASLKDSGCGVDLTYAAATIHPITLTSPRFTGCADLPRPWAGLYVRTARQRPRRYLLGKKAEKTAHAI
jgi:hypothetical protein